MDGFTRSSKDMMSFNEMHRSRICRAGSLRSITFNPGPVISNVSRLNLIDTKSTLC